MALFDCKHCTTVVVDNFTPSGTGIGGWLRFVDPFSGNYEDVNYPDFESGEIAKWGNKFYIKCPHPTSGGDHIKRFIITDEDCQIGHSTSGPSSVIHSNIYTSTGHGMCAKGDDILIMGSVTIYDPNTSSSTGNWICEVDVSPPTAVVTPLFQTPGHFVHGDIVYIPSTNTIVATMDIAAGTTLAVHYDIGGTVLGQSTLNFAGSNPTSMFSYDTDVYIYPNIASGSITPVVHQFDLTTYSVTPAALVNVGPMIGDAASHPDCFVKDLCYEIGDITDPNHPTIIGGAGGMIFATPFSGLNQTPYYYEVALEDVSTGTTPIDEVVINDVAPFPIQSPYIDGKEPFGCGYEGYNFPLFKAGFPDQGQANITVDTTVPNDMARYGLYPSPPLPNNEAFQDPLNPSGITLSMLASLIVGSPVSGSTFTAITPAWAPGTQPTLTGIYKIDANSQFAIQTIIGPPGGLPGQVFMALPYDSCVFTFSDPMVAPPASQPLKYLYIGGSQPSTPYSTSGAEFGAYIESITLGTSVDFGEGLDNTINIGMHPATPVWATHDIAANMCMDYFINSPGTEKWFLPSLMEFHLMFTTLGPGTPFATTLNLNTDYNELQDTYWTSSEITGSINNPLPLAGPSVIGGPDTLQSFPFAWAYTTQDPTPPYSAFSLPPGPHVIKRCNTLSVRPIRRFECIEREPDIPLGEDTFNWVDNSMLELTWLEQETAKTNDRYGPFTGIGLPGCSGSGWNKTMITGPSDSVVGGGPQITMEYGFDGTVGLNHFTHTMYLTDAAGNKYSAADFDDANNPTGYTFKMWTANKVYLGTWHYQNCNVLSYNDHIFKDWAIANNASWYDPIHFPDAVQLEFTNVTHIHGDYPIVAYGSYMSSLGVDEVRSQKMSGSSQNIITGMNYTHWHLLPNPKLHYAYNNEYEEGTFQGHTSSFCYMRLNCKMADAKPLPLPSIHTGQNTTYQHKNVVCLKDIIQDIQSDPTQTVIRPWVGGNIGVGYPIEQGFITKRYTGGTTNSNYRPWFPWNNNIYGGLTISGTNDELDHYNTLAVSPSGWATGWGGVYANVGPGDPFPTNVGPSLNWGVHFKPAGGIQDMHLQYPKHFLWTWHASFNPPIASQMVLYNDFLDAWDGSCSVGCHYNVGDKGPAGGIIVAVPYMNVHDAANGIIGPVVAPLQGDAVLTNPTKYYFEISEENLNQGDCNAGIVDWVEWGNHNPIPGYATGSWPWGSDGGIDLIGLPGTLNPTVPGYASLWVPDMTIYISPVTGGALVAPTSPASLAMELVGQGKNINDTMMSLTGGNPTANQFLYSTCGLGGAPITVHNAFELCANYESNGYDDWFLPNVGEMELARNYTAPGTLGSSGPDAFTSGWTTWNEEDKQAGHPLQGGAQPYWTCNTMGDDISPTTLANQFFDVGQGGPNPPLPPQPFFDSSLYTYGQSYAYLGRNLDPNSMIQRFKNTFYLIGQGIPGFALNERNIAYQVTSEPIYVNTPTTITPIDKGWKTVTERSMPGNVRAMRRFHCPEPFIPPQDQHTWNFCGYKDVFGNVSYFPTPWFGGTPYPQGPVIMDYLGAGTTGDMFYNDVVANVGTINLGEVISINFSPGLLLWSGVPMQEIYIEYKGILPWDIDFEVTGMLLTPTFFKYNNCGSATGQSIVDPDEDTLARFANTPVSIQRRAKFQYNIESATDEEKEIIKEKEKEREEKREKEKEELLNK